MDPDKISPWLSVVAVLFFECGAGLSLIVASVVAAVPSSPIQIENASEPVDPSDPSPPTEKRGRKRAISQADVVARIQSQGGTLNGSLNSIGKVIGIHSKSTAYRTLRELETAGVLTVAACAEGTSVRLAG